MSIDPERWWKLVDTAREDRQVHIAIYAEIAELAVPHRKAQWVGLKGIDDIRRVHSSFPQLVAEEFANRIKSGIAPAFRRWVEFAPSPEIEDRVRRQELAEMAASANVLLDAELDRIAAAPQIHQILLDAGIGVGAVSINLLESGETVIETIPPYSLLLLDGPGDDHRMIGREREMRRAEIEERWPEASLDGLPNDPGREYRVIELVSRKEGSRAGGADYVVLLEDPRRVLYTEELEEVGQIPFLVFRWNPIPGSGWGVGPLYVAMPDMQSINRLVYAVKLAANLNALLPVAYDSNAAANLANIRVEPGLWIPVDPGTEPPRPVELTGQLSFSLAELNVLFESVQRALFLDRLGPVTGPVKSATEILQRQAELARVIGAPYARLIRFLTRLVRRISILLAETGLLADVHDALRTGELVVVPSGPFARQQRLEEVEAITTFLGVITNMFGPEVAVSLLRPERVAMTIAENLGLDPGLLRSPDEIAALFTAALQSQQARQV